jgi:hypothetical protein
MNSVMRVQKSGFAHDTWEKVGVKNRLISKVLFLNRFNQNMM